ncbi:choice-of-anchor I family protein [uncultured Peptoniphilus sp.]|uniref:choice-of-anchor I family protein n=1 Tax=uncultured Peptoniphilus sp. TaxID=254354 RepID=UPI002626C8D5|nr:choice-of-anchor I family protein [uncultured Peptoniphilus sp.]
MKKIILKLGLISLTCMSLFVPAFAAETYQKNDSDRGFVRELSSYSVGRANADGGVAEIVTYNKDDKIFYVVSGVTQSIDLVKINSDGSTECKKRINIGDVLKGQDINVGDMTSVSYSDEKKLLAVAVQDEDYKNNGHIVILDKDGNYKEAYECGVQPDMVTFNKDGRYVLSADEGEPREGYDNGIDPKGSVTIINVEGKSTNKVEFNITRDKALKDGLLLKKDSNPVEDLEPEYIAISDDNKTAFVSLQENNAIASIDIESGNINYVKGLGFIDHSAEGNEIDAVRGKGKNAKIDIKNDNFLGTPMPDGIAFLSKNGKDYILTANEGDAREWGKKKNKYENTKSKKFDKKADKKTEYLDNDKTDGLDENKIYLLGGRSFSIYDASDLTRVYNSGSDFEKITARKFPDFFNTSNDEDKGPDELDARSNKKGPEPENVEVLKIKDKTYAIIGLERISGIMIYDITDPTNPVYKDYFNNRIFVKSVEDGEEVGLEERGNIGPEGLCAIEKEDSPTGKPLVLVANEVSGTVQVIEFDYQEDENKGNDKIEIPWTRIEDNAHLNNENFDNLIFRDHREKNYPVIRSFTQEKKSIEEKKNKNIHEKQYKFFINKDFYLVISGSDDNEIKIDVAPIIENDRTLLPMRVIAEILGAEVKWDEDARLATFIKEGRLVKVYIDSSEIEVNGEKEELYAKVKIVNDRILLPLTNISKAFNLTNGNTEDGMEQNIEWNNLERSITLKDIK